MSILLGFRKASLPKWGRPRSITVPECKAYLLGAMHDGTTRPHTLRIGQREEAYVLLLQQLIVDSGGRAWTYREGTRRQLYIVEFSRSFLGTPQLRSRREIIGYVRGYFDAEGGMSSKLEQPYISFSQKDRSDLRELQTMLEGLDIHCGCIHNPSRRVDPDYWRFYVRRCSHRRFARVISSWHPRKAPLLLALAYGVQLPFSPDYSVSVGKEDLP